jgi:hypothetical protein
MQYTITKSVSRLGKTFKPGTRVYLWSGYDYGLARDDSLAFKEPHVSVSEVENTSPFFTVPVSSIEKIACGEYDSKVIANMVENLTR